MKTAGKVIPYDTPEFRSTVLHEPKDSVQYSTLVMLGPEPLSVWEILVSFGVVCFFLASACSVVALLWWIAKLL